MVVVGRVDKERYKVRNVCSAASTVPTNGNRRPIVSAQPFSTFLALSVLGPLGAPGTPNATTYTVLNTLLSNTRARASHKAPLSTRVSRTIDSQETQQSKGDVCPPSFAVLCRYRILVALVPPCNSHLPILPFVTARRVTAL
jgi:hypothetical protein